MPRSRLRGLGNLRTTLEFALRVVVEYADPTQPVGMLCKDSARPQGRHAPDGTQEMSSPHADLLPRERIDAGRPYGRAFK
jgi:hypothetical protein